MTLVQVSSEWGFTVVVIAVLFSATPVTHSTLLNNSSVVGVEPLNTYSVPDFKLAIAFKNYILLSIYAPISISVIVESILLDPVVMLLPLALDTSSLIYIL